MTRITKIDRIIIRLLLVLAIVLIVSAVSKCEAQSTKGHAKGKVSTQVTLDGKMFFKGDEARNIPKNTIDLSARFIMQGNQQKYGYMIIFPEFTIRNTEGNLKSYTANIGYVWNELIIPRSEIALTAGWGWLDHYEITTHSWVFTQSYAFKIGKGIKAVLVSDFRQRSDLRALYPSADNPFFKWSLRGGFEISLN